MPSVTDEVRESLNAVRMSREHRIQLDLLSEFCDAAQSDLGSKETVKALDRLLSYSGLHFLSEQLLMRHHQYSEYDEHSADHSDILGQLRGLQSVLTTRPERANQALVEETRQRIKDHIGGFDLRLHQALDG